MSGPRSNTGIETDIEAGGTLVVGAGVAGLLVARALADAGRPVRVIEKSRGLGGRCATRRTAAPGAAPGSAARPGDAPSNRLDHGAQYVTARSDGFRRQLEAWRDVGRAAVWSRGFHHYQEGRTEPPDPEGHPRWIFPRGMNDLGKLLAEGIEVERGVRVLRVTRDDDGVTVESDDGRVRRARRVVVSAPAPQALELVRGAVSDATADALSAVEFAPSYALLAGYGDAPPPPWRGLTVAEPESGTTDAAARDEPGATLRWVAHDASKRTDPPETTLVAHARPGVAEALFDTDPDAVAERLLGALAALDPRWSEPRWHRVRRWRYALATRPHPEPLLRDGPIVLCGDWCGGAKVEAAWRSGIAAARDLGAPIPGGPGGPADRPLFSPPAAPT